MCTTLEGILGRLFSVRDFLRAQQKKSNELWSTLLAQLSDDKPQRKKRPVRIIKRKAKEKRPRTARDSNQHAPPRRTPLLSGTLPHLAVGVQAERQGFPPRADHDRVAVAAGHPHRGETRERLDGSGLSSVGSIASHALSDAAREDLLDGRGRRECIRRAAQKQRKSSAKRGKWREKI